MARGFSLLTFLLLAGIPGFGQVTGMTFSGMLRSIGKNNVVVESDDKTITTLSTAKSTKYVGISGASAQIGDFQPGDHVRIDANQVNNVYHASTMTMVREGTIDEHVAASQAVSDTSHPLSSNSIGNSSAKKPDGLSSGRDNDTPRSPHEASSPTSTGGSSSSSLSASSPNNDDPDRPRLHRATGSSDGTPATNSDATVSDARPSLQADAANGVTRTPPPPRVGAPADEDSSPGNMRQRMPESGDPVIDRAREEAFSFTETLPNYVVKQYTTRYAAQVVRGSQTSWQALDHVTADVIAEDGTEKYKNILVNGQPPRVDVEKTGSWTRGEFSSLQLDVLSPYTNARFHGKQAATIVNRAAFLYDFSVERPSSHWHIEAEGQSDQPAYTGSIWIDKENYRVLRIELSAKDLPRTFPLDTVESAVDYDYVVIGEGKYLLPVHSEALSCAHGSSGCTRNVIEFRNYKKFTSDSNITFDPEK
jgi:hypothetical protein